MTPLEIEAMSRTTTCLYCGSWVIQKKKSTASAMKYVYDAKTGDIHFCPNFTRELQYLIGGQLK